MLLSTLIGKISIILVCLIVRLTFFVTQGAEDPHCEGHECRRDWREDRQLKDAVEKLSDEGMRNITSIQTKYVPQ